MCIEVMEEEHHDHENEEQHDHESTLFEVRHLNETRVNTRLVELTYFEQN
jgi:hypothetical protein